MSSLLETLQAVKFLVDARGQRVAVQLTIADWNALLSWIETREDEELVKAALPQLRELREPGQPTSWVSWDAVKDEW
ncbi:hypothetical protein HC928_18720 [bacterium]|nr:hypothetical protein [bacterium]